MKEIDFRDYKFNKFRQCIHVNLNIHDTILNIIKEVTPSFLKVLEASNDTEFKMREIYSRILQESFDYLRAFVHENQKAQHFLIKKIELYNITMPFNFEQIDLIASIAKNNTQIIDFIGL